MYTCQNKTIPCEGRPYSLINTHQQCWQDWLWINCAEPAQDSHALPSLVATWGFSLDVEGPQMSQCPRPLKTRLASRRSIGWLAMAMPCGGRWEIPLIFLPTTLGHQFPHENRIEQHEKNAEEEEAMVPTFPAELGSENIKTEISVDAVGCCLLSVSTPVWNSAETPRPKTSNNYLVVKHGKTYPTLAGTFLSKIRFTLLSKN